MHRAPADALRALAEMPIAGSPPRLSTHPGRFLAVLHPPSRSALTSNPHSARCPAGANFPRLRALALFGRLSAERAYSLAIAGVQKPAQIWTFAANEVVYTKTAGGYASSASSNAFDSLRSRVSKPSVN